MSGSEHVNANIFDLNGHPVCPGQPPPVLRRTASGHLFQAEQAVVHRAEVTGLPPITPAAPLPAVYVRHALPPLTLEAQHFSSNQFQTRIASRSTPAKQGGFERGWGDKDNISSVTLAKRSCAALVELASPDTLRPKSSLDRPDSVINEKTKKANRPVSEDVWMQIARE